MYRYSLEQKVCNIGGVKVGGQPGENAPLLISSMFQKGDTLIESRKDRKFNKKEAEERIHEMERLSQETGVPGMVAMVANKADEMKVYVDFFTSVTDMPFAIDMWVQKPRVEAARYIAELGLQDRFLYNSITPWDEDIEAQVAEIKELGIKHIVVQAFDVEDMGPRGRPKSLHKLLPVVEKGNFESILVDTAVMGLPLTAFSLIGNRLVKEEFGLPVGCAPSNGTYMYLKAAEEKGKRHFPSMDAAIEAITAMGSDFIFYGPMTGSSRVFPAVAAAISLLATWAYDEGAALPSEGHPLNLLFPDVVEQLSK
ncbi:MAG TPA: tetrahydromethanopterin S-methyltransferase subunit H [Dehalococcoidia bacterium]|nr:tetrahydromethanopterin S-methyltransferase subunit H [Dehalococcoidia bacterium]